MNQLQKLITRIFRLEKPIDKRLLWLAAAVFAFMAYFIFNGLNDSSSSASISFGANKSATGSSGVGASGSANAGAPQLGSSKTQANLPKIYVHIVGEVEHPGLYLLMSGARLADAILEAGGFSRRADQASVNLARVITDGEQIVVLRLGSDLANNASATSNNGGSVALINLNRGSESEIESLPGVGPTLAGRIIDWRLSNGGFKTKADLQKVTGIGDKLFSQLKDLVTI